MEAANRTGLPYLVRSQIQTPYLRYILIILPKQYCISGTLDQVSFSYKIKMANFAGKQNFRGQSKVLKFKLICALNKFVKIFSQHYRTDTYLPGIQGYSSVTDPGCLSRVPDPTFFHPRSRIQILSIPDPHQKI